MVLGKRLLSIATMVLGRFVHTDSSGSSAGSNASISAMALVH
jgi:hypothetical protein